MSETDSNLNEPSSSTLPSVTVVFLVYNRREELERSLQRTLRVSDYDSDRLDVIVVDNASQDGSADMVAERFPEVHVIRRETNCGVSGWNDGFAVAQGDYVLALDDDCYLPEDGLRRAVAAAREHEADLVSFAVASEGDPEYRFDQRYRTGLLTFWGCAVLMRRPVLSQLRGYDPEIFVWANELEFMLRFFDAGFRHVHAPEIVAVHMKHPKGHWSEVYASRAYLINARHFGYIAGKLLRGRDAFEAVVALISASLIAAIRTDSAARKAIPASTRGFLHGLRHRTPVRSPEVSKAYRANLESFASPWWISRPPLDFLRDPLRRLTAAMFRRPSRGRPPGRREQYYEDRERYHPKATATLDFGPRTAALGRTVTNKP